VAEQRFQELMQLEVANWRVTKGPPLFPKEVRSPESTD